MTDDVLAVKYSPDGRFLAVSLLDSTVKIFFQDTLKFFLSLYGHKVGLAVGFRRYCGTYLWLRVW
jgi:U3 small nucleolar RNA-associated protein 12